MSTVKGSNGREVDGRGQLYQRATIDVLVDDVLLEVFSFYLDLGGLNAWHTLVHVCRRWRQLVFASPRRLNLRLLCRVERPMEKLPHIWPALPIVIRDFDIHFATYFDAALEHNDRICELTILCVSDQSPILNSMKKPFPALTSLTLTLSSYDPAPVLSDSFLGGSAPRLRNLTLSGIQFLGLPKLLLSAHHLVHLDLYDIPMSGYISPEAMVTCLSSLTQLKEFTLRFRSSRSHPDQTDRHRPPFTRTALPSLISLRFEGVTEYFEYIVARIDVPLLTSTKIRFFKEPIFDTPLLRGFISRTEAFKVFHRAKMFFSYHFVEVTLVGEGDGVLKLGIVGDPLDRRLSAMVRVCNPFLPPLPTLEQLYIYQYPYRFNWQDDIGDAQWLELLRPFITVKSLYLEKDIAPCITPALQEELAGESAAEVLPALQKVFVQGPAQRGIAQFVAARELLGHPVASQDWDGKWRE